MNTRAEDGSGSKYSGTDWQIWGIPLFGRGEEEVLKVIGENLASGQKNYWIATVNPEFVMAAKKDAQFKALLTNTNLNVVDGIGLVWAKRVLAEKAIFGRMAVGFKVGLEILAGKYSGEIAAGVGLMDKMGDMALRRGQSVYFLGGWGNRSERTALYFRNRYPGLKVAGYYGGKSTGEDEVILKELADKGTDILFVAYGMKSQEEWIGRNLTKLRVKVVMGVGRSFDYYSGDLRRAPSWVNRMGLEWLFSLLMEPKRFKRQLVLPKFIWKVIVN